MPLMMLLTSCGEGGSFLRVNNSLGLASFIGVGLLVGACLGFIYAIMPRIDIITRARFDSSEEKSYYILRGGTDCCGHSFFCRFMLFLLIIYNNYNLPYGKLYFNSDSAD